MKKIIAILILTFFALSVLAGCTSNPEPPAETTVQKPLIVFLVRHAEKMDDGKDPELSDAGKERAGALANALAGADIEYIHSSDFIRTRETAKPIAAETGIKIEFYDPKDLAALAKGLRETGGRHLVVGHSNTTPELAELLGGNPGAEIDEKAEYDRLYIVTVGKDGTANSAILSYGKAFAKKKEKAAG